MNLIIIFIAKYLVFVLAAIAVLYSLKQSRKKQKEMFIFAVLLLPLAYIVAKIISRFYFDPRPFVVQNFTPLILHAADNGFPSDHTLLASAIALGIFHYNRRVGLLLFILALIVGISRVLAGVHHFVDIGGSVIIALIVYFFVKYFFFNHFKKYFTKND